ncbi:24192_t:CDS:2 [Gigaspora margarita]|uniref:24192_t:CDS:1 n=1 Tax=Gigaspora margarita TaxID=4874 RepID=A0ABN7UHK2_GIGMA|nr:24192_t:CDS:2 [Gigaspora margarita]
MKKKLSQQKNKSKALEGRSSIKLSTSKSEVPKKEKHTIKKAKHKKGKAAANQSTNKLSPNKRAKTKH